MRASARRPVQARIWANLDLITTRRSRSQSFVLVLVVVLVLETAGKIERRTELSTHVPTPNLSVLLNTAGRQREAVGAPAGKQRNVGSNYGHAHETGRAL